MLPNLAGKRPDHATDVCRRELRVAGIDAVNADPGRREVASHVEGRFANIRLWRAWYYWVVEGDVPLAVARKLYADPAGPDIRVDGDCCRPAPADRHVRWVLPSGREVLPTYEKAECERYAAGNSEAMRRIARDILRDYDFHDDPAAVGASGFVRLYHIDSEVGLRVFADAVKADRVLFPEAEPV